MTEYLDAVDENDVPTGLSKEKRRIHRDGDYHRTAHVWLINDKNELLLQLRSPQKSSYPNYWDISAAGHIRTGETVIEGALRELKEELSVDATAEQLHFICKLRFDSPYNNEFGYVYLLKSTLKEDEFIFRDHEVTEVRYVHYEKLEEMVRNKADRLIIHNDEEEILFDYIRQYIDY
ncbi:MAG: NUDIX domain-containing protein [Erysipelotrichaceae bacterium]|nr:NUDIX domain-containing protein [Erysipelotrichaceae bacterium]